MSYSIKLENIYKKYEDVTALDNINFELQSGKVYGLIGRNGAGKTTMLKVMSDMISPSDGNIIYNKDYITGIKDICFMRDTNHYFGNYKLKRLFYIASKIYPDWDEERKEKLVKHFKMDEKKYYIKCSKGMQTLTSIIIALSSNAKVILLDEPYSGLDPVNRESFYQILREICFDGEKTVLISSHLIQEIEGYFQNAVLIDHGKILIDEEVEKIYEKSYLITCNENIASILRNKKNILKEENILGGINLYIYDYFSELEKNNLLKDGAEIKGMDLQKLLLAHTQRTEVTKWL